ncbi:hypothetical protein CVT25_005294 [Psilocybe cyanescens]|uniref:Nephrocystin 3-like N-terminal domain-containing protein n=1 Tax=Psilocybe cyanescens TaxID=93625 RepID=A0A409WWZ9_PSICY|nr:hypothetical protein CVT25_005294 [Psilocybe cyanescens]
MSQYFPGSSNFTIESGIFNTVTHQYQNPKGVLESLQKYVAHGAFYDSGERFDPPKCHPNTRVAIINRITDWISGLNEDTREAFIMWLYGAAGAGKSAIAQTIAEILHHQHFIFATFFFSRNDPQRGAAKWLVTTLAYQLATQLPQVFRERVAFTFEQDPLIVTKSIETQFMTLVREPLLELLHSGFSTDNHMVIIIDGLDECDDPKVQARIVDLSFRLLDSRDLPLKILIASRPEIDISSSFDRKPFSTLARIALDDDYQSAEDIRHFLADKFDEIKTQHRLRSYIPVGWPANDSLNTLVRKKPFSTLARIALDDDYQSAEDIRHFLADKFDEIKTQHRLRSYIPVGWPANDSLNTLVRKSSGQFIYASTVVKYVASAHNRPTHRLEVVLGIHPPKAGDSPFAELDALYQHILMGVEHVDLVLRIIDFVVLHPPSSNYYSVTFIEAFFSLAPGDVQLLMQDLGSLISVQNYSIPFGSHKELMARILHASLKDYLLDQSRSKDFFLDRVEMHTQYAELCLAHMMELPSLQSNWPLQPITGTTACTLICLNPYILTA